MTDLKSNLKSFVDKADEIRNSAAESLESAAGSVRAAGNGSAETIHTLADEAGKKLDSTAAFVRPACARRIAFGGLRNTVRRNPIGSLALAAAVGVVAGFSCRR